MNLWETEKESVFIMKRIFILLLWFALAAALSGCVNTPAASPSPTLSPAPTPTVTISAAGAQQVFLPNGSTPQDTFKPAAQPKRLYEDVTKTLIPSDEYGHIWPYIGACYKVNMMGDEGYEKLFGFCDDKGRIICDPVFTTVQIIEKDGAKLYKATIYKRDAAKKSVSKITLARPDGNWAQEYDELQTDSNSTEYPITKGRSSSPWQISWGPLVKNQYISVRKGNKWGLIDYYGREILPCVYNAPLCFLEGLASILSDDEKEIRFIDIAGNIVLGPYQTPPRQKNEQKGDIRALNFGLDFYEGRVRFYKDGKYGVIDKSGKIILEPKYDYISTFYGGSAAFISGDKAGIMGLNGEVLLEPTSTYFSKRSDGTVVLAEKGGQVSLNLSTGERTPWTYQSTQKYYYNKDGGYILKLKDGDKLFPDAAGVYELSNGNLLLNLKGSKPSWIIVDSSGATAAGPFEGRPNYYKKDGVIDVMIGEPYNEATYEYWHVIYDETGKRLIPGYYLSITPFDGRYMVQDDTDAGLVDENGKWVIKVPLNEFMGD